MNPYYTEQAQKLQNERWAQPEEDKKMQLAPLAAASNAAQTRLALYADPKDPTKALAGHEQEYAAAHEQLADIIGKMRTVMHPPPPEDPHGLKYLGAKALDKLHITRDLANTVRQDQQKKVAAYNQQGQDITAATVQSIPYNPLTPDQQAQAARVKAGIEAKPVDKPVLKQYKLANGDLAWLDASHPEDLPAGSQAVAAGAQKPAQEPKPLEAGGVLYGVSDPNTGKQYLASQMTDPNTPDNVKEIWKTVRTAQDQKKADEARKEQEREDHFLQAQGAIADRMGRSEQWQATMADYREQLGQFKTLDAQANKTQELADTYKAQYDQPGNHSATDTALLTDYTSVLAAGGRKTQAEIQMARNIGSYKLNWEQKLKKATTGELPQELRKMYLDYIEQAAKTQREDANKIKPDVPQAGGFQGPKTKQLRSKKSGGEPDIDAIVNALNKGHSAAATQP